MSDTTVEQQIGSYLSQLNAVEKEAVLTVVKTIAQAKQGQEDLWEDQSFTNEMERRRMEYESGKAKLYKFGDMKQKTIDTHESNETIDS